MGQSKGELKRTNVILSNQELDNLTNGTYSYKCVNDSLAEPYMIPFWNALILYVPTWVHPNILTLLGSLSILPSFFLFSYFSWGLTEWVPGWVVMCAVMGIFLFQTLDNLDGRQARRLKLSSPIGDWFDHSLDILSMYLLMTQVGTTLFFGNTKYPFLAVWGQMAPAITHYYTFWDRRFTGEIYLGAMSITEGQFIISSIMTWGWWLGEEFWSTPVVVPASVSSFFFSNAPSFLCSFFAGVELIYADFVCFVAGGVFTITTPLEIVARVVKHEKKMAPLSTAFFRTCDLFIVYFGTLLWAWNSTQTTENVRMMMYTLGLCVTNVTTSMLLASITHGPFRGIYWAPLPWFGALHCYFNWNIFPEEWVVIGTFIIALCIQLFILSASLLDMRGYFQYPLFHVRKNAE